MPQPTQGGVVAESIPPRIDIELPPAPIVMTEQAVVSTTGPACRFRPPPIDGPVRLVSFAWPFSGSWLIRRAWISSTRREPNEKCTGSKCPSG